MSFTKIYRNDRFLCLESFFVTEKISFDSIEDILIFHVMKQQSHRICIFLNSPVFYELRSESFFNKLLFSLYKLFNRNSLEIKIQLEENDLAVLFQVIETNLPDVRIPDIRSSLLWRTVDGGFKIPRVKLVYSRSNSGLAATLKKYKILMSPE